MNCNTTHYRANSSSVPGDPTEARQFFEEAVWAYRWRLDEEAAQASESAWALGMRNDSLALLRLTAAGSRLGMATVIGDLHAPKKPPSWIFDGASVALDRLQESLAWKGEQLSEAWVGMSAECLWQCSQIVRACYYTVGLDASEIEAIATLRRRLRLITDSLHSASAQFPNPRVEDKSLGFPQRFFADVTMHSIYSVRGIQGSLWQENARDCIDTMKTLFDELDAIADPSARARVKNAILIERPCFAPWIAYWNPAERSEFPFAALMSALLDSPSPERPIDVALILIERRDHVFLDVDSDRFDADQSLAAIVDLQTALWNARGAVERKQLSIPWFLAAVYSIRGAESHTNEYASPRIDAGLDAFRVKLFKALLSERIADGATLDSFDPPIQSLTLEDKRELLPLIQEALTRVKSDRLKHVARAYETGSTNIYGSTVPPAPARADTEYLHPAWTISEDNISPAGTFAFSASRWRNNRLYFLGRNLNLRSSEPPSRLFVFDPRNSSTTKIDCPRSQPYALGLPDVDAVGDDIFMSGGGKVAHYIGSQSRWDEWPVAGADYSRLFILDGTIYVAGSSGVIVRVDPATGKTDLLASSRRRPALTILDDLPPYDVLQLFKDEWNRLCVLLGSGKIDRYDEAKANWEEIFSPEKALEAGTFDRNLLLRAIGPEGIHGHAMDAGADLLGLLLLDKSKSGVLPPPPPFLHRSTLPSSALAFSARSRGRSDYAAYDGADLWILGMDETMQRTVLTRIPADSATEQIIPIEIGGHIGVGLLSRFVATREGILIYNGRTAYFFRRDDLLRWPQASR